MQEVSARIVGEGLVGAFAVGGAVLGSPLLRAWYSGWGATPAERLRALPGDAFVPRPRSQITCAVTIAAPAVQIWPWLVQLGCRRGGWYSYDLLDNAGVASAERILPAYQELQIGDIVSAVPDGSFGFPVAQIDPERALILAGTLDTATGQPAMPDKLPSAYFSGAMAWVMEPLSDRRTRLIYRMRTDWNPAALNLIAYRGLVEPISFVMGRKMLLNLKRRCERLELPPQPAAALPIV